MRVEEELLCVREIVVCLSIFNQRGLQNNIRFGKKSAQGSHHMVKNVLRTLMQRQGSNVLVS